MKLKTHNIGQRVSSIGDDGGAAGEVPGDRLPDGEGNVSGEPDLEDAFVAPHVAVVLGRVRVAHVPSPGNPGMALAIDRGEDEKLRMMMKKLTTVQITDSSKSGVKI